MKLRTSTIVGMAGNRYLIRLRMNALLLCFVCIMVATGSANAEVGFAWETVETPGAGGVNYGYRLAKHEVTRAQYAVFLNAVAADDTYNLYSGGGITRSGSPGSYSYMVPEEFQDKPMDTLSWFDAARFVNWLHNGQPTGAQDLSTTELGAYDMHIPSTDPEKPYEDPVRLPGARFFLPREDEWGKAAYHDPRNALDGGPPGDVHSWAYPTQNDLAPTAESPPGGSNSANYDEQVGAATDVGAYTGTTSYYGIFDMVGNAWEWNEGIYSSGGGGQGFNFVSVRGVSGGGWFSPSIFIVPNPVIHSQGADLKWAGIRIATTAEPQLTTNWIEIGDPGNGNDPADGDHLTPGVQNFGNVDYVYQIGREEVTNAQYAQFLNAVDPAGVNPNQIYNDSMATDEHGGILFEAGNAEGSKYIVKVNKAEMPVNFVSWFSAARFANWMNNGKGTANTETGAYDMSLALPVRLNGAKVFLPSDTEWYKAAFYDPRSFADGGPPGDDNYWAYPTQSDHEPTAETAPGGTNSANLLSVSGGLVDGVAFQGTMSYYGLFDLAGNVWEWNEAIVDGAFGEPVRVARGGGWSNSPLDSRAELRPDVGPTLARNSIGFRLASLPDFAPIPGDMNDDGAVNAFDIEGFVLALLDPDTFTTETGIDSLTGDINQDGALNAFDIGPFVELLTDGSPAAVAESRDLIAEQFESNHPFRIIAVTSRAEGIEIEWFSVQGSIYTVEYADELGADAWNALNSTPIVATESSTLFSTSLVGKPSGYFRVRLQH